jgi:hypothetical protein
MLLCFFLHKKNTEIFYIMFNTHITSRCGLSSEWINNFREWTEVYRFNLSLSVYH